MQKKNEKDILESVNGLLTATRTGVKQFEQQKQVKFWMEMQPYLSSLGLPMPEAPQDVFSMPSLIQAFASSSVETHLGSLEEGWKNAVTTKSFSVHQIIGIMEKYGHLTHEECVVYREKIFETASEVYRNIEQNKVGIGLIDSKMNELKSWAKSEAMSSEEAKETKKELIFNAHTPSKQGALESLSAMLEAPNRSAYECLEFIHNTVELRDALKNPNKFEDMKHKQYVGHINEFNSLKEKFEELETLGGVFAKMENEDDMLREKVVAVGHDELTEGVLGRVKKGAHRALTAFNDEISERSSGVFQTLKQCEQHFKVVEGKVKLVVDELSDFDNINLRSLEAIRTDSIAAELGKLKEQLCRLKIDIKAEPHSLDYFLKFYKKINTDMEQIEQLEGEWNRVLIPLETVIKDLSQLATEIHEYKTVKIDSLPRQIGRAISPPQEGSGKTKKEKLQAAEVLHKQIVGAQDRSQAGEENQVVFRATAEGDLGSLSEKFKRSKQAFSENIDEIKKEKNTQERSEINPSSSRNK